MFLSNSLRTLLISRSRKVITKLCTSTSELHKQRVDEIANVYEIKADMANIMIKKNKKLQTADINRLKKLFELMKSKKIKMENVGKLAKIATFLPGIVKNRYNCLIDLGYKDVSIDNLLHYKDIMKSSVDSALISWNPIDAIVSRVEGPPNLKQIILTKYKDEAEPTLLWLHRIVVLEYLSWRLNLDQAEIIIIIDKYPSVGNCSVTTLKRVINKLLTELQFSIEQIIGNGFLLKLSLENVERMQAEHPTFGGISFQKFVHRHPHVLLVDTDNITQINEILHRYNVTTKQIVRGVGGLYGLKPPKVEERLKLLEKFPNFEEMKSSIRLLDLVYSYERVAKRSALMKSYNLEDSIDLTMLTANEKTFNNRLTYARNIAKRYEICKFLSNKFQLKYNAVKSQFSYLFRRVIWIELELEKIEETCDYLLNKFRKIEIEKNLPVVLFDVDLVKNVIESVKSSGDLDFEVVQKKLVDKLPPLDKDEESDDDSTKVKYSPYGRAISERYLTLESYLNKE